MMRFLKYFFSFILVLFILVGYFLFTDSGKEKLNTSLSQFFSQKSEIKLDVTSLNVSHFPQVTMEIDIENKAVLTVVGDIHYNQLDINYTLTSNCIVSNFCTIDDDVLIRGQAKGDFEKMYFTGKGKALNGTVSFEGVKFNDRVEDLKLSMHQITSEKLFILLGEETLLKGKADVDVNFELMNETHKHGSFSYDVIDNNFSGMPITLHTDVQIKDMQHTFTMEINAPSIHIKVKDGTYNQETKQVKASYDLNIKELADLEILFGYKYLGAFDSKGEVLYDDALIITGYSESYGGMLDYIVENGGVRVGLHDVSFKSFMNIFPYQPILDADTTGNIFYNIQRKTVIVNAQLNNAKFERSNLAKNIYKKSRIKIHKETFDKSNFDAAYCNGTFTADIRLQDKKHHVYLTNTIVNTRNNTINTYFDLHMQKKAYTGSIYGDYDNPTVSLDTKKAINYQFRQKLDAVLGKKNRKRIERFVNIFPMASTVKDFVSESTSSFVDMLF